MVKFDQIMTTAVMAISAVAAPHMGHGQIPSAAKKIDVSQLGKEHLNPINDFTYFNKAQLNNVTGHVGIYYAVTPTEFTPEQNVPPQSLGKQQFYYDVGSSTINMKDERNQQALGAILDFLRKNPDCYISLYSSTSTTGTDASNQIYQMVEVSPLRFYC